MLSGDRATELKGGQVDRLSRRLRAVGVDHKTRMKVPVAGVPDGSDHDVVLRSDRLDASKHLRQLRSWHADVLGEDHPQALNRPVRHSPDAKQLGGLGRIGRDRGVSSACRGERLLDRERGLARVLNIDLGNQHRGCCPVETDVLPVVDGPDRRVVHQLKKARLQSGGHDVVDRLARRGQGREHADDCHRVGLGTRSQLQRGLGHDAERALGPDE